MRNLGVRVKVGYVISFARKTTRQRIQEGPCVCGVFGWLKVQNGIKWLLQGNSSSCCVLNDNLPCTRYCSRGFFGYFFFFKGEGIGCAWCCKAADNVYFEVFFLWNLVLHTSRFIGSDLTCYLWCVHHFTCFCKYISCWCLSSQL